MRKIYVDIQEGHVTPVAASWGRPWTGVWCDYVSGVCVGGLCRWSSGQWRQSAATERQSTR